VKLDLDISNPVKYDVVGGAHIHSPHAESKTSAKSRSRLNSVWIWLRHELFFPLYIKLQSFIFTLAYATSMAGPGGEIGGERRIIFVELLTLQPVACECVGCEEIWTAGHWQRGGSLCNLPWQVGKIRDSMGQFKRPDWFSYHTAVVDTAFGDGKQRRILCQTVFWWKTGASHRFWECSGCYLTQLAYHCISEFTNSVCIK